MSNSLTPDIWVSIFKKPMGPVYDITFLGVWSKVKRLSGGYQKCFDLLGQEPSDPETVRIARQDVRTCCNYQNFSHASLNKNFQGPFQKQTTPAR